MNQYPTVYLTLKDVDGLTFSSAYEMLSAAVTDLYKEHLYLLDSKISVRMIKGLFYGLQKKRPLLLILKRAL